MKKHVTIVGAIQVGFGTLGLIAAFVVYFALSFAKGFIQDQEIPNMIIGFLRVSLPILIAMLSILGLVGGIGLLSFKPWARILVICRSRPGLSEYTYRNTCRCLHNLGSDAGRYY